MADNQTPTYTKHEAVSVWLSGYPLLNDWLYFNTIENIADQVGVSTIEGDAFIEEDVTGNKRKEYQFAVIMIKAFDVGASSINADAIAECENFMKWIDMQNSLLNFPQFPSGCKISEVVNLQNMPSLALIDENTSTAKYTFPIRIIYDEK